MAKNPHNINRRDRQLMEQNGAGTGMGGVSIFEKFSFLNDLIMQPWFPYVLIGGVIILGILILFI